MTMKHYSKFVVNYLVQLLRLHKVRNTLYSTVHYITVSVILYCTHVLYIVQLVLYIFTVLSTEHLYSSLCN